MTRVAIIGGGLAGTACAYFLRKAGAEPVIYEAGGEIAGGASGNMLGLYNPRLGAELTPESRFYKASFERALGTFETLPDIDWSPCGALHLITDEKKEVRYRKMAQNWGWPEDQIRLISPHEASDLAGIEIEQDALYLPQSGFVSPPKLCRAYAQGVEIRLETPLSDMPEADAVILAAGPGTLPLLDDLPLKTVRGQVTHVKANQISRALKTVLCYSGYITPGFQDRHIIGSTFQRWLAHTDPLPQDDQDNLAKLGGAVAAMKDIFSPEEIADSRAALRTTAPDHFPVIGHLRDNIYVSTAHGSHGILSSLSGAQILTARITNTRVSFDDEVLEKLSPHRF